MCVKWKNVISEPIRTCNGVKQGSVISPALLSVYLDVLLTKLQNHEAGCRIGTKFCGAVAYADDLTLMCPSVKGLQSMINLCENFGKEYSIKLNETKTECIRLGKNFNVTGNVCIGGKNLDWKKKVKHLGNIVNSDLTDVSDVNVKRGSFYSSVKNRV